jgi:large subunit ribosomal protein L6
VKGPKGEIRIPLAEGVSVHQEGDLLTVRRHSENRQIRANHGLMRALIANMVTGVSQGFEKKLEINGVGYKAAVKGRILNLNLGYSHPINFQIPEGIDISVEKGTLVSVKGINKEKVGQTAAVIRGYRPPDSYKGKGVRYEGEVIRLKAGKSAKK